MQFLSLFIIINQMILKEEEDSVVDYHCLTDEKKTTKRKQLKTLWEQDSDFKFYSWDFKENYTYITYLKNFHHIFESAQARKRVKVFSHISKLIKTRNPYQIKSHHQKMLLRHRRVEGIIEYLKIKILKFLKANPQGILDIETINRECEAFFIEQSSFVSQQNKKKSGLKPGTQLSHRYLQNILIKTGFDQEGNQKIQQNGITIVNQETSGQMVKTEVTKQIYEVMNN